jgi:hypothetical protein
VSDGEVTPVESAPVEQTEPAGAHWVGDDATAPDVVAPTVDEFVRDGSPAFEDYIAGLRTEFALASEEQRAEIKKELDRVAGLRSAITTADAPKVQETA